MKGIQITVVFEPLPQVQDGQAVIKAITEYLARDGEEEFKLQIEDEICNVTKEEVYVHEIQVRGLEDDAFVAYTVYDHPTDFPNHFVVRRHKMADGKSTPQPGVWVCDTLEQAREFIPPGMIFTPRHPLDDAKILETWI